jgi:hypothetical protein
MELAHFRAEKRANISREKWIPEWCNFQNLEIYGTLQGGSRVCTLHLYLWGVGVAVQTGLQSWGYLLRNTQSTCYYYRGTSLIRNQPPLEPYSRPRPRVLGGVRFLMSEVPL